MNVNQMLLNLITVKVLPQLVMSSIDNSYRSCKKVSHYAITYYYVIESNGAPTLVILMKTLDGIVIPELVS